MNGKFISGIMLTPLLTSMLVLAFNIRPVEAQGAAVDIRADGSIDPPTAPIRRDGDLYTLTGNITSDSGGIYIGRDNMTLDGAGYTIQGTNALIGISLSNFLSRNVTIKNTAIEAFYYGIYLGGSGHTISGNTISNNKYCGIELMSSGNNISGNTISNNKYCGIELWFPHNHNNISGNTITDNENGICLEGSGGNFIGENNITNNVWRGIDLYDSAYNIIFANTVTNSAMGVYISDSSRNTIVENTITNSGVSGICLTHYSTLNSIHDNAITNNTGSSGITLDVQSDRNSIHANTILNNYYGVYLTGPLQENVIMHNNFVNNTWQAAIALPESTVNIWDDGYPSGGNYWSDYGGVDYYHGPFQNETGGDGIGDTPYVINANNTDNYPFMTPRNWLEPWDITGPTKWIPDNKCDVIDIAQAAILFGSYISDGKYDRRADIIGPPGASGPPDGKIDIRDIALVVKHFGETYP